MKEIANWKFFDTLESFKKYDHEKCNKQGGYLYLLKIGENVKIGKTKTPKTRISSINGTLINYIGKDIDSVLLSTKHTEYSENEKILHRIFKDKQIENGEMFNVSFDDTIKALESLSMTSSEKEEVKSEESILRTRIIERFITHHQIKSAEFYDYCIQSVKDIINSKYKILIEESLGVRINNDFESALNDFNFIKATIVSLLIIELIEYKLSFSHIQIRLSTIDNTINDVSKEIYEMSKVTTLTNHW